VARLADVLVCEGAPRDLGLDQGRWCRSTLVAGFRAQTLLDRTRWRLGFQSDTTRRIARDLRRYFPQQAEAIEGMSRGAGVPEAWLVELLARETRNGEANASLAFGASRDLAENGALLARTLPAESIVRRCRPDGGFASVELLPAWSTAPFAGVNERGLAVTTLPQRRESATDARCAAPVSLLAHDCLARFESLDAAVDWCMARPGGGAAALLLADASGEIAGVHLQGSTRRVFRPADGLWVQTSGHAREGEIGKALREAAPLVASDLARFLGMPLVSLDPDARKLGLLRSSIGDGADRWFGVGAEEST